MKTQKLKDAVKQIAVSAIIYGESGIGKTHFAGTLPGKTLIIAAEPNGIKTLSRSSNIENISVVQIDQETDKFFDELALDSLDGIDNVVLDSATELANQLMIAKTDPRKNGGAPAQHTYLEVQWSMKRYLRTLRDLAVLKGKNVIVIALESELTLSQSEDVQNSKTHPSLAGKKLAPEAEGLFDIVGHMEKMKDGKRFILLEGNDTFVAKDRFGRKGCFADGATFISGLTGKETKE